MNYRKGDYFCVDLSYPVWKFWDKIPNWCIKHFTHSRFSHAGVIVSDGGYIVEARPWGAQLARITEYDGYPIQLSSTVLTTDQRDKIAKNAISFIGTPYNFPDIGYLALYTNGVQWNWLLKKIENDHKMICSQLVAEAGVRAGVDSWLCGKSDPQLVTPADLDNLAQRQAAEYVQRTRPRPLTSATQRTKLELYGGHDAETMETMASTKSNLR